MTNFDGVTLLFSTLGSRKRSKPGSGSLVARYLHTGITDLQSRKADPGYDRRPMSARYISGGTSSCEMPALGGSCIVPSLDFVMTGRRSCRTENNQADAPRYEELELLDHTKCGDI